MNRWSSGKGTISHCRILYDIDNLSQELCSLCKIQETIDSWHRTGFRIHAVNLKQIDSGLSTKSCDTLRNLRNEKYMCDMGITSSSSMQSLTTLLKVPARAFRWLPYASQK